MLYSRHTKLGLLADVTISYRHPFIFLNIKNAHLLCFYYLKSIVSLFQVHTWPRKRYFIFKTLFLADETFTE